MPLGAATLAALTRMRSGGQLRRKKGEPSRETLLPLTQTGDRPKYLREKMSRINKTYRPDTSSPPRIGD